MLFDIVACLVIVFVIKTLINLSRGVCRSNTCLVGKTVLITGGNAGIGYETVLGLASRGCRIIIASRNNTQKLADNITRYTNNGNVVLKYLDYSSLNSVRRFAQELMEEEKKLDIFINNSGILSSNGNIFTKDGLQLVMQINYFGPFLLLHLLTDLLKKSGSARVVLVSSIAAYFSTMDMEDLNNPYRTSTFKRSTLKEYIVYYNSKACITMASTEFARRWKRFGISVNSLHPGGTNTGIYDNWLQSKFFKGIFKLISLFILKSNHQAAQTTLHLATSYKLRNTTGEYFMDCKSYPIPPLFWSKKFRDKIWLETERLVKLRSDERLD